MHIYAHEMNTLMGFFSLPPRKRPNLWISNGTAAAAHIASTGAINFVIEVLDNAA